MERYRSIGVRRTPHIFESLFPSIIWGDGDIFSQKLFLTFDDGPLPDITPEIYSLLIEHQVPATFFLRGDRLESFQANLNEFDGGYIRFGYHGFSHMPWWFKSKEELIHEMTPSKRFLDLTSGKKPPNQYKLLLRPPFGRFGINALKTANTLNAGFVLWRLVIGDWETGHTVRSIKSNILHHVRGGDIIVLHDGGINRNLLPSLLQSVIPHLRDKGFTFESLDELIMESAK